ncbi:rod shape-determining protein [Streptomyces sp. TP-A0874]|uniref:rod shape-determining protein n=1 Tax=Streptomyces sp. TP-A0874 TaxID=549819 RepID=UPI000852D327|nr:rod shape-determining protein [Streptomyces sp. TP-A0874]
MSALARRFRPGVAIDMGSARTRAWLAGRGMVLNVPTVSFSGSGPRYPVRRGAINDADECARLLERLLAGRLPRWGRGPLVVCTLPVLCGPRHRQDALTALEVLGPRTVLTVDGVRAAALGAGADVSQGLLVVDAGAEVTEVALVTEGSVVGARRAEVGIADGKGTQAGVALVPSVARMVEELLGADDSGATSEALSRGILLVGGGALWPELADGISRTLSAPVRRAPVPHVTALRGAALLAAAPPDRGRAG